jgi:hypothetical protein
VADFALLHEFVHTGVFLGCAVLLKCLYDLGTGLGSLTLGAFLDLVDQNFSLMYAVASMIALLGLWGYWKRSG